jgi:hypothetical protein
MLIALGAMTGAAGLFLFLWYRTLAGLSVRRQPAFLHAPAFKWGVPAIALVLLSMGLALLAAVSALVAAAFAGAALLAAFAVLKFDRYTADMRAIHEDYRRIRAANPGMPEFEALFHTAERRYAGWSEDRLVELVAGKDIAGLILLIIIKDNEINPISDWELYRRLKLRVGRVTGAEAVASGSGGQP